MIIPAAAQIEAAAAELPSVPTDALVTQRHELSEFGAERLQELGASGLSQDAMIGYALGLQTARVMIKENVEIQMKGLNPAAIL